MHSHKGERNGRHCGVPDDRAGCDPHFLGVAGGVRVDGVVEGSDHLVETTDVVGQDSLEHVGVLLPTSLLQHVVYGRGWSVRHDRGV